MTDLNKMAAAINKINIDNGWDVLRPEYWEEEDKIPRVLALIHSEVSEALEAFRHRDRKNFEEELADVLIRTLDAAGGLGIDIQSAVIDKVEKNKGRGYKHGGKFV